MHDTLLFHSKVLNKIVSNFQPNEFEFSKTELGINNDYLINDSVNIIELLAKYNLKIKIIYPKESKQHDKKINIFFGQPKHLKNVPSLLLKIKFINNLKLKYIFKYKN